jgi:hypothetical protein
MRALDTAPGQAAENYVAEELGADAVGRLDGLQHMRIVLLMLSK